MPESNQDQFDISESLAAFLRAEDFPIDELGQSGCYFKALAERFALPVEMVTLTGLTITGSLLGKHGWIDVGYRVPACLFVVCGVEQIGMAQPIVGTMLDGFWREYDEEDLFPEQPTLMHIINDLTPRGLLHAFAHSNNQCLLYLAKSGAILRQLRAQAKSRPGLDLGLVGRCLNRELLNLPGKQTGPAYYPFPSLSLLILAEREDFDECLAGFSNLPQELRTACIMYDSEARAGRVSPAPVQRSESAVLWDTRLGSLIGLQSKSEIITLRTSAEARAAFASFQNALTAMLSEIPKTQHAQVLALPGLAVLLSGAVHSLQGDLPGTISAATAGTAIKLIKCYAGRQFAGWIQAQRQTDAKRDQSEDEIMLNKIKVRAPLDRRTLFRSYRKQLAAIHEPTLARLFERGLIVQDEQGRIALKSAKTN